MSTTHARWMMFSSRLARASVPTETQCSNLSNELCTRDINCVGGSEAKMSGKADDYGIGHTNQPGLLS